MKVYYDKQVDSLYIEFNQEKPDGVVEIQNGLNIDMLPDGRIGGIEILDASKKIDIQTLLTYSIDAEILPAIR